MPAIVASSASNSTPRVVADCSGLRSAFSGDMAMPSTATTTNVLAACLFFPIRRVLTHTGQHVAGDGQSKVSCQGWTPLVPVGGSLIRVRHGKDGRLSEMI